MIRHLESVSVHSKHVRMTNIGRHSRDSDPSGSKGVGGSWESLKEKRWMGEGERGAN